jgi:tRNA G37 N-methylase Trm5
VHGETALSIACFAEYFDIARLLIEKNVDIYSAGNGGKSILHQACINKAKNVELIKGDVKKVYKKFKRVFDRIAMPLPHTGYQFLKEAFYCIKPNGMIHFYEIVIKDDFATPEKQIMDEAKKAKRKVEIVRKSRVRSFSPVKEQVVFDIFVLE